MNCPFCDNDDTKTLNRGKVGNTIKYVTHCNVCNGEGPVAYIRTNSTDYFLKSEKYKIHTHLLQTLKVMKRISFGLKESLLVIGNFLAARVKLQLVLSVVLMKFAIGFSFRKTT